VLTGLEIESLSLRLDHPLVHKMDSELTLDGRRLTDLSTEELVALLDGRGPQSIEHMTRGVLTPIGIDTPEA
jgi:hypothetical protein